MLALTFDVRPVRWSLCKVAGWITPRAFWSVLSGLRLREMPRPALPRGDWVRLRPILGGICGTDLGAIFQRGHPASFLRFLTAFPVTLGHENVSVVEEVGPQVEGWEVGTRVCVEPTLSCVPRGITPACPRCQAGEFTLCENITAGDLPPGQIIGWNSFTGGSWSSSFVAHQSQLHRVPDSISDEEAVLVDPIACAVHGILRHAPSDDQRALILGGGIVGLGVAAGLRALGCRARVTAMVRHGYQADLMRRFGADERIETSRSDSSATRYDRVADAIGGKRIAALFGNQAFIGGFDVVYDCIGTGQSLTDAMKFTRGRGTTVVLGTSQIAVVDMTSLWFSELAVIGCNGRQIETYQTRTCHTYEVVFDLIRNGKLDLKGLLTHRYKLRDYRRALLDIASRRSSSLVKAAFVPEP